MANKREWNFTEGENSYNVTFEKNKLISVNGSEPVKIAKLKSKESNILEAVYDVDLGDGKIAKLCMRKKEFTLVFEVLYIVNFFVVMGGALGACVSLIGAVVSATIASNKKMNGVVKVICCIALYAVLTVVSFFVAYNATAALKN